MAGVRQRIEDKCSLHGGRTLQEHEQPYRQLLHAQPALYCRRSRTSAPSAMLRMFQRKDTAKIVRSGTPVLRKVSVRALCLQY